MYHHEFIFRRQLLTEHKLSCRNFYKRRSWIKLARAKGLAKAERVRHLVKKLGLIIVDDFFLDGATLGL